MRTLLLASQLTDVLTTPREGMTVDPVHVRAHFKALIDVLDEDVLLTYWRLLCCAVLGATAPSPPPPKT